MGLYFGGAVFAIVPSRTTKKRAKVCPSPASAHEDLGLRRLRGQLVQLALLQHRQRTLVTWPPAGFTAPGKHPIITFVGLDSLATPQMHSINISSSSNSSSVFRSLSKQLLFVSTLVDVVTRCAHQGRCCATLFNHNFLPLGALCPKRSSEVPKLS